MSARISKVCKRHKGVNIYCAANTHPGSRTTALVVFTEDLNLERGTQRFRYIRSNGESFTNAICAAMQFINQYVDFLKI